MKKFATLLVLGSSIVAHGQNTCTTATPIGAGTHMITVIDGTQAPQQVCIMGETELATGAEWYSYTPTQSASLIVSTDLPVNTDRDTRFSVFTGTCSSLTCVAGDDDSGEGYLSVDTFNVHPGNTYYIAFDDYWETNGFAFSLQEGLVLPSSLSFVQQPLPITGNILCVVDMNGDFLDDVVKASNGTITILYQQDAGGWTSQIIPTDQPDNMPSWSIAAGDIDGNGRNDLVYGGGEGVTFMMSNDDGTYYSEQSGTEYVFSQRTNFIDINNDGLLDAFVCHDTDTNVYYLNNGSGMMEYYKGGLGDMAGGGNYGSIWVDYDNDGDMDMFIAKCRGGSGPQKINQMHRNNGDGTFTEVAAQLGLADPMQTWSAAWGDYDNDGDMDAFIGVFSFTDGAHKLMRNNGDGTFTDITAGSGFENITTSGVENVAHDFNNDGFIDVFGAGSAMMLNNGDMTFTQVTVPMTNGPVGDLNNDGFLDIVRLSNSYINEPNGNNWIKFNMVGTASNLNGIGARVEITSALGSQIREVRSGDGFGFMSTLNVHFGLGQDPVVDEVIVRWPSGTVDTYYGLNPNTTVTLVEGAGPIGIQEIQAQTLSIHPSPAVDILYVTSTEGAVEGNARITDIQGREVMILRLQKGVPIDISGLASGQYSLQVGSGKGHRIVKFMKQ
jgi:hypothetical protein